MKCLSRLIQVFFEAEKSFLFSDLAAFTAKSENKKGFSTSEKTWVRCSLDVKNNICDIRLDLLINLSFKSDLS